MRDTPANSDPASLDNLHDIVVPPPTPWWPPATGWYVLIALLLIVAVWWSIGWLQRWWRNRYRREALMILGQLRTRTEGPASTLMELDQLLKRVALAAWPRETVAPLSGQAWVDFLKNTGDFAEPGDFAETGPSDGGVLHQSERWEALHDIIYSKNRRERLTSADVESVFAIAKRWIETHRCLEEVPPERSTNRQTSGGSSPLPVPANSVMDDGGSE